MNTWRVTASGALLLLAACSDGGIDYTPAEGADERGHVPATRATAEANAAVRESLPLDDQSDFEAARRGLIASDPDLVIEDAQGNVVWDMPAYDFVQGEAPASVNPSLWRQAKLNNIHGLFEVTDGIYQLRGYDLANMTLIEGDEGWIVVDPLTSAENAEAAMALAREHVVGDEPITAVLFTHSHIDHFGGVAGILDPEAARRDGVRIVAPAGFMHEATSENILAGPAMGRRAIYMYGGGLARSPRGHVGTGLGKAPSSGHYGILEPTDTVDHTGQTLTLDGVEFVFQYVPESEAPAEFTFYLPAHKTFGPAEIVSRTLHNVYTPRGAKVRDALKWSNYIDEAIDLFGDEVEVLAPSHHWPTWGNEEIVEYMKVQRDTYKYIHDQTLRLANSGLTPNEIAERLELPPSLREAFHNRDYYGTVSHNAKAVYQWYFGWFDGNPAHLESLPETEAAARYVEFMGGADAVVEKARASFEAGEYRWTAEVLNHVVFAQPDHREARKLLARTYDQLGYRAESGPWRDIYLSGAQELRHGARGSGLDMKRSLGLLRHVPVERFFDAMATRLNGPDAVGTELTVNFNFTDLGANHVLTIDNAVLHHEEAPIAADADVTLNLTRDFLLKLVTKQAGLKEMIFSDELDVDGSRLKLLKFFSLLEDPEREFAIVTP